MKLKQSTDQLTHDTADKTSMFCLCCSNHKLVCPNVMTNHLSTLRTFKAKRLTAIRCKCRVLRQSDIYI